MRVGPRAGANHGRRRVNGLRLPVKMGIIRDGIGRATGRAARSSPLATRVTQGQQAEEAEKRQAQDEYDERLSALPGEEGMALLHPRPPSRVVDRRAMTRLHGSGRSLMGIIAARVCGTAWVPLPVSDEPLLLHRHQLPGKGNSKRSRCSPRPKALRALTQNKNLLDIRMQCPRGKKK